MRNKSTKLGLPAPYNTKTSEGIGKPSRRLFISTFWKPRLMTHSRRLESEFSPVKGTSTIEALLSLYHNGKESQILFWAWVDRIASESLTVSK
jgi:hypothetical protein